MENGRTSDGLSHSPLLINGAVPASPKARRAAGSSAQPKILSGRTGRVTRPYLRATVFI